MKRNDFIQKVHYFNHSIENDYENCDIFPKDSFFSVEINEEDISVSIDNLKDKMNEFLKKNLNYEISKLDLVNLLGENSFTYKSLSMPYNKLYGYLLDKEIIKEENIAKTKIYRIENNEGNGLYRSMEKVGKAISDHFDFCRNTQPSPMEDGVLASLFGNMAEDREKNKDWFFGFSSKQEIQNWLEDDGLHDFIIEHNPEINIVEYEVVASQSIKTEKQIAFRKYKAEKKQSYKLSELDTIESLEIKNSIKSKLKNTQNKKQKIS